MSATQRTRRAETAPHEELIVACCAACAGVDGADRRIREASEHSALDWPGAIVASIRHGVAPVLSGMVLDLAADLAPRDAAEILARIRRGTSRRNAAMMAAAAEIVGLFKSSGVPALLVKGVPLAVTAYPEPALRGFADVDVLVPEARFEDAGAIAQSCGYTEPDGSAGPSEHHAMFIRDGLEDILSDTLAPEYDPAHAVEQVAPYTRRLNLEIHRGLFVSPGGALRRVDLAPFWKAPHSHRLPDGTAFEHPRPEAALVHLAAHAASHGFRRLMFPLDAALLVRQSSAVIDWGDVVRIAHSCRVAGDLWRLLDLASREFRASTPTACMHELASAAPAAVRAPIPAADVFDRMRNRHSLSALSEIATLATLGERTRAIWQIAFPPASRMGRIYGVQGRAASPRMAALYALRPFRLTGRLVGSLVARRTATLRGPRQAGP